jgi:hypothetical protein
VWRGRRLNDWKEKQERLRAEKEAKRKSKIQAYLAEEHGPVAPKLPRVPEDPVLLEQTVALAAAVASAVDEGASPLHASAMRPGVLTRHRCAHRAGTEPGGRAGAGRQARARAGSRQGRDEKAEHVVRPRLL